MAICNQTQSGSSTLRRPWCATIRTHDLSPMIFGTVWTERSEGEERARVLMEEVLLQHFPTLPEILNIIPGMVMFVNH